MKFIKSLFFSFIIFAFIGCASTESTSTELENAPVNESDETAGVKTMEQNRTLIDLYISGDIAGYK